MRLRYKQVMVKIEYAVLYSKLLTMWKYCKFNKSFATNLNSFNVLWSIIRTYRMYFTNNNTDIKS